MTPLQRSRCMSKIRSKNTKPELALRRALFARGLRFRTRMPLLGRPDIIFTKAKLVVFVDGCFWHGCPIHGTMPKSNQDYWSAKLARNRARDAETTAALEREGWCVLRHWAHEIAEDAAGVAEVIQQRWRERVST
jgi:DNA mismatch endonuclease (patch repair protein)